MSGGTFRIRRVGALAALCVVSAAAARAQNSLTMTASTLPAATAGADYKTSIAVRGGAQPYNWQVVDGKLPSGLKLDSKQGTIAGTPTTAGQYNFTVEVADSGVPINRVERTYTIVVTAALTIDWKQAPQVNVQTLSGSVLVSNRTGQDFTLTVIVMAVNEIGRATALGYQEFTLASGAQQVIPFGSEPGAGKYVVHADAVAEVAAANKIYRARKQTAEKLVIQGMQ